MTIVVEASANPIL